MTITSAGVFQDFLIDSGVTAIFTALTIAGGSAGRGRRYRQRWHTDCQQSLITGNTAGVGGGIYNAGTLHVINTTFSGNQSVSGGAHL